MRLHPDEVAQAPAAPPTRIGYSGNRLRGRALRFARVAWVGAVLSTIALFVMAIPVRQTELLDLYRNLSPSQELILKDLGASGEQHASIVLAIEVVVPVVFLAVSLLVYWQRPHDWLALLVSGGLVTYIGWTSPPLDVLARAVPSLRLPVAVSQALGFTCALVFLYVFPDGRFVPPWTRLLLPVWGLFALGWVALPGSILDLSDAYKLSLPAFGILMGWLGTGMSAQVYRYLMVASPTQRQQTKLVIFGTLIGIIAYLTFGFNRFALPVLAQPVFAGIVYDLIGVPIFLVLILVIPVAFAVSILRYRLWDADVVVNHAIVYGVLTAILAGLYTTSITLSQRLFVALTGERSDAAIVFTTLVVASAFAPVRTGLQTIVDRYLKPTPDPRKEVQALGTQMRAFVEMMDIELLARRVCDEAVRAFDATGGAVYFLRDGHFRLIHTSRDWAQVEGMSTWLQANGKRFGWIALGPRRNQAEYEQGDRALFSEIGSLAARAMWLVEGAGTGERDGGGAADRKSAQPPGR